MNEKKNRAKLIGSNIFIQVIQNRLLAIVQDKNQEHYLFLLYGDNLPHSVYLPRLR